ncbi:MAG: FAD-binding protein, partial [Actinomycetia bacterium]|nr:FAD-binding protein [Actinomycetes bacterium]
GRGSPHGGVFLDVASRLPAQTIRKKLPSMYHQFKELASVDITAEAMEVGPTCHYVMGGVEVEPDTGAAVGVPGLFAAGEVAGGMHGSNRLGGNSLSDLLVFGRRAGAGAALYLESLAGARPPVAGADIDRAATEAVAPFDGDGTENPYTVHTDLQLMMNDLVGIIRRREELQDALEQLEGLKRRAAGVTVEGHRQFNPGWHLALDLDNMLLVSECVARAALMREESRGGHTREDHPVMSPEWRQVNLICRVDGETVSVLKQPLPSMPTELLQLFDRDELDKYMTMDELTALPEGGA